jgi:hypothetical protein
MSGGQAKQQQMLLQQQLGMFSGNGKPGVRVQAGTTGPDGFKTNQKFFNSHQPPSQQLLMMGSLGTGGPQQSSEGILQMMKKREKLNNSALSTTK